MKRFCYHSHGCIHAVEVPDIEPMTLKYQVELERALARSEQIKGASRE